MDSALFCENKLSKHFFREPCNFLTTLLCISFMYLVFTLMMTWGLRNPFRFSFRANIKEFCRGISWGINLFYGRAHNIRQVNFLTTWDVFYAFGIRLRKSIAKLSWPEKTALLLYISVFLLVFFCYSVWLKKKNLGNQVVVLQYSFLERNAWKEIIVGIETGSRVG